MLLRGAAQALLSGEISMRTFIDYFMYSEGNVKALLVCCCISLFFFVLFVISFFWGGQKQKPQANVKKSCPKCGNENGPGTLFCIQCGTKL